VPFTNAGQVAAINALLDTRLVAKLYTNRVSPSKASKLSDFTEASGFGYSSLPLEGKRWTLAGSEISYPEQTWTFAGELGDVSGYYIVQEETGTVILAERFTDGPYKIKRDGDRIKVTPRLLAPIT